MKKFNSTIEIKTCKCGCGKPKTMSLAGYNSIKCMPEELQVLDKFKKTAVVNRNRAKLNDLSRKVHSDQENILGSKNASKSLDKKLTFDNWYFERRKEMVGCCINCGRFTNKKDDKYYRWSICHIVPKALIPSVATHKDNWVELCQECHSEFDNTFDKAAAMLCFEEIKAKFQLFAHLIPNNERRKINPHLLN